LYVGLPISEPFIRTKDAARRSWAIRTIPNEPNIKTVRKTDSFTAKLSTSKFRSAIGCHLLGLRRKEINAITVKNVKARKKLSSLPNLEKYNIVGLVRSKAIEIRVPIMPRLLRQTHGRRTTAMPEIAGSRRAMLSD
tara:strand:+ start:3082 stop:3492 length:411 start_codon:yes stop_codon:yes gene_type:complete